MEKFVYQCFNFEHASVIERQPVESLEDECHVRILSVALKKKHTRVF